MLVIALCALSLVTSQAGESAARAGGYLGTRGGFAVPWSASDPGAPPSAALYGAPRLSLLTEANLQLRLRLGEGYEIYSDLSLFVNLESQATGLLAEQLRLGNLAVPSELYASLGFSPHAGLLLGRKRVLWGAGFAWNPADVVNPPKDPTDPTFQRAGAWMARVEVPFERFTVTALWAPKVTALEAGLPRRFLYRPGGDAEQLVAARIYVLLADADLNLMWFWSSRYADALPHSHRLAFSVSRYVLTDYELHLEAVAQRGRDAIVAAPECLPGPDGSAAPLLACAAAGTPPASRPYLEADAVYAQAVAGTRTTFSDDSLVSAEYFYNGTGLSVAQFRDRQRLLAALPQLASLRALLPPAAQAQLPDPVALLGAGEAGQPQRFAFRPSRRHYLFLVWQKPRIADDFTAGATLLAGLEDWSGLLAPSLSWSAREWLSLAAFAFVPFGAPDSEYGGLPFRFRAFLEVKAYY